MSVMVHWWSVEGEPDIFWDLDDITPEPDAIVRKTRQDSNHGQWGMLAKILLATGAMAGLRIVRFGGFGGVSKHDQFEGTSALRL